MKKREWYLSPEELGDALEECQAQGNRPTERVCRYFALISQRLMGSPKYKDYSFHVKEDMASAALEKCIRNIKNYKAEHKASCFNYFTRCVECAFFEYLRKHYKRVNAMRQLMLDAADKVERFDPLAAKKIRDLYVERKDEQGIC